MGNQYDETKKLLNVIRSFNNKKRLFEDDVNVPNSDIKSDITNINNVDVKFVSQDESDLKLSDEQKNVLSQVIDNFKQQVTQIVEFEPGFIIKSDEIRLDGNIKDEEIVFTIIVGENDGLFINTNMSQITDEFVTIITKLKNFEKVFKTALEPLINDLHNNI